MTFLRSSFVVAVAWICLGLPTVGSAQFEDLDPESGLTAAPEEEEGSSGYTGDEEGDDGGDTAEVAAPGELPLSYAMRPLTLPAMNLRADFTLQAFETGARGADTAVLLNFGGAFGILDDLEVGISRYRQERMGQDPRYRTFAQGLLPILVSPDGDFGDMTPYVRWRFLNTDLVEIGVQGTVIIPTSSDFGMNFGLPIRFHFAEMLSLDTGFEFGFQLDDDPPGLGFGDDDVDVFFTIPAKLAINPIEPLFIGIHTGFTWEGDRFNSGTDGVIIPLGVWVGYALALDSLMIDFVGGFDWPFFLAPDFGNDTAHADIWELDFGVRLNVPLG